MARPASAVRLTATAVGAAYAIALYLSGVHIQTGPKDALSYLPTFLTFAVALWDIWLWRLPGLQRLAKRSWIAGTWKVTLTPTAASRIPEGGNRGPIDAYVVITQTFWSIGVRQYTAESKSDSRAAMWGDTLAGPDQSLTYTYVNRPRREFEDRSTAHLGTAALDIVGLRPKTISGDYFTDRYAQGDMKLTLVDRTTHHADFLSAERHSRSTRPPDAL
jgi:SMODS-associating 2TM, beta-strand rich effector domain